MRDSGVTWPVVFAASLALVAASGCAAGVDSTARLTPSPEPPGDRGTPSPTSSPTPSPTPTTTPVTAASATPTVSALADRPSGSTGGIVPAPGTPPAAAPTPSATGVEVTPDIQAFIDAARTVTSRGEAVTAATLSTASPQVSALLAARAARLSGDALQIYVSYSTDLAAARAAIEAVGGTVELDAPAQRLIQARVPVVQLTALQSSAAINRIRLPEATAR